MPLGIYSSVAFITVGGGVNVAASASVEVRKESDGLLASIFSDRDGLVPLSNPFNADGEGRFQFYAAGIAQGYQIQVTHGADIHTLNNQPVGTLQERDTADVEKMEDDYLNFHFAGVAIDETIMLDGFFFDQDVEINKVTIFARDVPIGSDLNLDFTKGGAEQSKISTLAAGASKQSTPITGLIYTASEEMGMIIKDVGSTFEGAELDVFIHYNVPAL